MTPISNLTHTHTCTHQWHRSRRQRNRTVNDQVIRVCGTWPPGPPPRPEHVSVLPDYSIVSVCNSKTTPQLVVRAAPFLVRIAYQTNAPTVLQVDFLVASAQAVKRDTQAQTARDTTRHLVAPVLTYG